MRRTLVAALLATAVTTARAESPRWGSFDISAGNYNPDIDAEFTSTTAQPFQQVFGSSRGWMFRVGAAKSLFTTAGSVEVGFQTGYYQRTGTAQSIDSTTGAVLGPSGDKTTFRIIPTTLTLTYRFDVLAERYHVPLAPYGRAALERFNWWVTDGGGSRSKSGATNGWSVAGGLALLLDFFDADLARELDRDTGVNHTYLYFEAKKSWIDDFGSSASWDLSEKNIAYSGGLLFVF